MNDRNNTIAGWVLFAGIVALGASIVTGEMFKGERPEEMGYPIEGVVEEGAGAEAEKPIAFFLQTADVAKGEAQFKKCAACHTIDAGGPNGIGPSLFGTPGKSVAGHAGFAYSDALKGVGGSWDWDKLSSWIANPKKFAPGTKMAFAGLSNPQDRADLLLFLNSKGGTLTVPPPPAEEAPAAGEAPAEGNDAAVANAEAGSTADKAPNVPVVPGAEEGRGKGDADAQGR